MRAGRWSLGSQWRKHRWKAEKEMTDLMNSGHKLNYKEQPVWMFSYKTDHSRTKARWSPHSNWWQDPSKWESMTSVTREKPLISKNSGCLYAGSKLNYEKGCVLLLPAQQRVPGLLPSKHQSVVSGTGALSITGRFPLSPEVQKSWKIDLVSSTCEKKEVFHAGGHDLACYSNPGKWDCACCSQRNISACGWTHQGWQ